MGTEVQNEGGDICPVLRSPQVLILLPPARASSPLLSWGTAPPLWFQSLSTVSHLQCGKVQLEMFLKQTTLLWSKHLFLKDCFTNNAVQYICFCKFKIIQINLPWVFAKKRKKKISSKLGVAFQGVLQEQAWLQAVHSVNSGSEEISSNCSLWTFCARLNFELQFFPSLDKPRLLYASSSLFCSPPHPRLWKNFLCR